MASSDAGRVFVARYMFMRHTLLIPAALAALIAVPALAGEGREHGLWDRPTVGEPLRFQSANGGSFRPRALVIQTGAGASVARLPATSDDARSEDRVDLSGTALIGGLFQERLAADDARAGDLVGPVYRSGDTLIVDAGGWAGQVTGLPVTFATHTPQTGPVSYRLGRLSFAPAQAPGNGGPIGQAYVLNGQLVIASPGNGAPGLDKLFGGL